MDQLDPCESVNEISLGRLRFSTILKKANLCWNYSKTQIWFTNYIEDGKIEKCPPLGILSHLSLEDKAFQHLEKVGLVLL